MSSFPTIVPSILSADFAHLEEDIQRVTAAGATILHLDIMDGNFVPNISFGSDIVKKINSFSPLKLDTHLMVLDPDKYIEIFQLAGSDILTVHVEACRHLHRTVTRIKELGMKAGVALNPSTPAEALSEIIPFIDLILVMTVNPGFGGQKFIEPTLQKIQKIRELTASAKNEIIIEVDGGIDAGTIVRAKNAGATYFVAGNAIFGDRQIESNFQQLKSKI